MKNTKIDLPEIPSERADDLHNIEYIDNADLVLFMAGNQFMVMDSISKRFQREYPEVKKIFYETLPPGLELKQILAGGAHFRDMVVDVAPDIYTSVAEDAMKKLSERGLISEWSVYLHNRIVLMVSEGNPLNIRTVSDLGQDSIRISQPGDMEDISIYITDMYKKAGGDALVKKILEDKKTRGTTLLTIVHHRETPLRIRKGIVDVGPVWATEVINSKKEGLRVDSVEPGEDLDQRDRVNYFITRLNKALNPENADKFMNFIKSEHAQDIYKQFGFLPHFT
jgi:ABC-type molybdate transport system substrate-binding protein